MKAFTTFRPDRCPICNKDRALELYDMYNHPVRYSLMIDRDDFSPLNDKKVHHLRCRLCKNEFELDWTINRRFPFPLDNGKKMEFLDRLLNKLK